MVSELHVGEQTLQTTDDGFLLELPAWTPAVAEVMAQQDELSLSPEHWEIIEFVRAYYAAHSIVPIMRILAKAIARELGEEKAKTRYLYGLFAEGPVRQASRYGGLPKPPSCI